MKLFYTWSALLKDGSVIKQFDGEEETKFSVVDSNMENITNFRLDGKDESYCNADLVNGEITFNGNKISEISKLDGDVKLIYSRRNQVRVKVGTGEPLDSRTIHRLGVKDNDEEIVVEIFPGLEMAEKKVSLVKEKKSTKEASNEDITSKIKE